jgi:hypothetical protein
MKLSGEPRSFLFLTKGIALIRKKHENGANWIFWAEESEPNRKKR